MDVELSFLIDKQQHLPTIARWYFEEWEHKISDNSLAQTCERLRTKLRRDRAPLHVVAWSDDTPFGCAQLKIREMDIFPDYEYWLGSVFVAPSFRGVGIASQLASRISEVAVSFGATELYLQTEDLTGGLYKRLGWKPLEEIHYGGLDVLVMVRHLDSSRRTV